MLFSEADGGAPGVFRSRVRVAEGQRHTVVPGEQAGDAPKRFVFRRVGYTVEMRLDPATTLSARAWTFTAEAADPRM